MDFWLVTLVMAACLCAMVAYQIARTGGEFSALVYPDESEYYLAGAKEILAQGIEWFLTPRSLWSGPISPLWIALFGAEPLPVKVANLTIFALGGMAVWDVGRRLFGRSAAYLALTGFVLYLPFYRFMPTLLTEPLFVPLVILSLWLVVVGGEHRSAFGLAAGLALGVAALVRPVLQLYPVVLVGSALTVNWILSRRRKVSPHLVRPALMVLAGFAMVVLPYVAKNIIALDRAVIANGFGSVLYLGNDLRKGGYEPVDSMMKFDTDEITSPYTHFDSEGDRLLFDEALRRIRRDPIDVIALQPSKFLKLTFGSPEHYFRPQSDLIAFLEERRGLDLLRIGDLVLTVLVLSAGVIGLSVLPIPPLSRLVMVSLVAYLSVVNTILFPIPRMLLPAMPVLMVAAGGLFTRGRAPVKLLAVLIAASAGLFIAVKGTFDGAPTVSERYVGYFDEVRFIDGDSWSSANDIDATGDTVRAAGPDPYLVFDVADFEAEVNQMIFITMTAQILRDAEAETALAQVFWRTGDEGFTNEKSESFEIEIDGEEHIYAVSPSFRRLWEGTIAEIRVDLPEQVDDVDYRIVESQVRR